jgi:hypothetical protein
VFLKPGQNEGFRAKLDQVENRGGLTIAWAGI